MRRVLILLAIVALATAFQPTAAGAAGLAFTRSPAAGPNGTAISLSGSCDATQGYASLITPMRGGDVVLPPIDSTQFTVGGDGRFTATLHNNSSQSNDTTNSGPWPGDLGVVVRCGDQSASEPFASTPHTTGGATPIFTSDGPGACGSTFSFPSYTVRCQAQVKGFNAAGDIGGTNFYVQDWLWGASIAVGDVTGDGALDVVTGSLAPDAPASFVVSTPTGRVIDPPYSPYGGDFDGGLSVAVGDVNGDGRADLVTGAGPGGGPHVLVFTRNASGWWDLLGSFYAYAPDFHGGVNVAVGDVTGDGVDEIITGAGPGGGPHVRVFNMSGAPVGGNGFMAYDPGFTGGVFVAAGDLSPTPDTRDEIITGAGPGGGPHVRVFTPDQQPTPLGVMAYDPSFRGGVVVAAGRVDNTPGDDIVTGPAVGGGPHIRVFNDLSFAPIGGFYAYGHTEGGTRVAVAP